MRIRIIGFALSTILFALCFSVGAQQPKQFPRIGWLSGGDSNSSRSQVEGFRQGLRELGYVEGQNILLEYRWAEGKSDRYPVLAGELVHLRVDVIVTIGTQAILAAKRATNTIPIIAGGAGDLVGEGLVDTYVERSSKVPSLPICR
jgi:putative ABC transport system substrate-binding protein